MKSPWARVIAFVLMFIAVLIVPWWVSLIFMFALTLYFPMYLEAMIFAFIFDFLYSARLAFPYPALSFAFVYLVVNAVVRERIRI